jgi:hypothetical protein
MSKKDLAQAAGAAADKFFSSQAGAAEHTNVAKHTNVTHKSKHYDERGKRDARYGLLLDKQLKEDLTQLCTAAGSRSMNDYIVSLLIEHTEKPESKKLLQDYKNLQKS